MEKDTEIQSEVLEELLFDPQVDAAAIGVSVNDGVVSPTGHVRSFAEKVAAEKAAQRVKGVGNMIGVKNTANAHDISSNIKRAFHRNADVDAGAINIAVDGGKVTLTGKVRAWSERMAAEQAAWATPGVSQIVDHLSIQ